MALKTEIVEGLKGKSKKERTEWVRAHGDIVPGRKDPDRETFMQLVGTGELPEGAASEEPVTPPPEPPKETPPVEPPKAPEPPPKEPVDEWEGYGSKEELLKAHKETRGLVDTLTEQVRKLSDRINGEQGPLGRKVKELEGQLSDRLKEVEDLRKKLDGAGGTQTGGQITAEDIPEAPDPDAYSDGVYDAGYKKAIKEYNAKLAAGLRTAREEISGLKKDLTEAKTKATEAHGYIENTRASEVRGKQETAWSDLWGKTVPEIQQQFKLPTTVDIKRIDDAQLAATSGATEEERANAKRYLATLPPSDLKAYQKAVKIVTMFCDFDHEDGNYPVPKDYRGGLKSQAFRGHLIDAGVFSSTDVLTPESLPPREEHEMRTAKQLELENGPKTLTTSELSQGDRPSGEITRDEAMTELRILSKERNDEPIAFQENSVKWNRYCTLRKFIGLVSEPKKR